ncbi:hypothetical protein AVEN_14101-1 [Araneus ventricosus]|uniref:Uncharacterized protein n=1 Tax=Araneus ventricosus TaxID=182803 RepID=A0A4Y2PV66_ARAVE|nr:hypothetical protein AVEN_14101-1 [Araneus ventricosus]
MLMFPKQEQVLKDSSLLHSGDERKETQNTITYLLKHIRHSFSYYRRQRAEPPEIALYLNVITREILPRRGMFPGAGTDGSRWEQYRDYRGILKQPHNGTDTAVVVFLALNEGKCIIGPN